MKTKEKRILSSSNFVHYSKGLPKEFITSNFVAIKLTISEGVTEKWVYDDIDSFHLYEESAHYSRIDNSPFLKSVMMFANFFGDA